jgi:hypothetical protein
MEAPPMKDAKHPQVVFGPCCYCNRQIESTKIDPCMVKVQTRDGLWQVWHCHARCFRERIFAREDGLFDPAHF